jgi:3-methyl-2-oxobutanoate hydroxymethyltransferase
MVKLDGAADNLGAVEAITQAGIPVFAQFGVTPQTSLRHGVAYNAVPKPGDAVPDELLEEMIGQAKRLEGAGAALLNFTNSGPVVGPVVAQAVSIPVVGGFGGGPWLDGRVRMVTAAIGYSADNLDNPVGSYANVASVTLDAINAYAEDVRAARQIA